MEPGSSPVIDDISTHALIPTYAASRNRVLDNINLEDRSHTHFCAKSLKLELDIVKLNETVRHLQKKIAEKNSILKNTRNSLNYFRTMCGYMKAILHDLEMQNLISEKTRKILEV